MAGELLEPEALNRLMTEMRPRLHRYCARMVGSVFDGEDVVQEALAKAVEALPSAGNIEKAEAWLFAIAHNTALDALRRRKRRAEVTLESDSPDIPDSATEADSWIAATASLATIMQLPVIQRSTVVLMDVLEYSLAETVEILGTTLPAVKAALHRGRVRLKSLSEAGSPEQPELRGEEQARLRSYADSFNTRDFDTLRNLLAEDVRLDLVNRLRLAGRKDVSVYFGRYGESSDWEFSAGLAEGRPALLVSNPQNTSDVVDYVVLLDWSNGRIRSIRDFRYAKYITDGLTVIRL
ncbi:MAG TPA: RNA polymerase sigma factor [Steroidobacteraceae bacterium]|jgi:RNA polymerase sigma-70 factor (ECF subfamily)